MASLRTLFLGVYASNRLIRALFLPLCYIALLSPFTLVAAWYFGLGKTLQKVLPVDFSWFDLVPQIALSAVLVLLPTRLLSSSGAAARSNDGGKRRIQSLPYWIPGIRHLSSIAFGGEEWLKGVRDASITGITSYKAAGTKHNIVFSDSLLDQIYENWSKLEEAKESRWALLKNAFNVPKSVEGQYFELSPAVIGTIKSEIFTGRRMEGLIKTSLAALSESLPDFVTFNSSIVDQMQWERVSNVELTDGTLESECDLFTLINEFCCNAILPAIVGAQFTESYQLLATDLASFNQRFWALALGLPRLSPIQGLPGAALAQKRLLQNLTNLFRDLTNPPKRRVPDDDESVSGEETDADITTPIMKLNEVFTQQDVPMGVRGAIALQLVHSIMAKVVPLVFWTLLHIYSSSVPQDTRTVNDAPVAKIREETKAWAQAIQPPSIHPSFPAPPEVRFLSATEAPSSNRFPYLRSCVGESRRLYNSSVAIYKVTKAFNIADGGIVRPGEQEDAWELEAGSYIDIGLSESLINSSQANHVSPDTFKPDRFVTTPASSSIISPIDASELYKTALVVSLVAGIIQLWEIAPAPKKSFLEHLQEAGSEASAGAAALNGEQKAAHDQAKKEKEAKERKLGKWVIPKAVDGYEVKIPKGDIRVRVRRREGLPTSKVIGRIG